MERKFLTAFLLYRWTYNTPPDSPRGAQYKEVVYEVDMYAIPSIEGEHRNARSTNCYLVDKLIILHIVIAERREIYFIAIIDVLTQYGVKKQVHL